LYFVSIISMDLVASVVNWSEALGSSPVLSYVRVALAAGYKQNIREILVNALNSYVRLFSCCTSVFAQGLVVLTKWSR
jgi:hypothetical protein